MKKYNSIIVMTAIAATMLILFDSCGANTGDAQKVIDKYCELNVKEHTTAAGAEKEAATAEKKAYEKEVDDKYFKDNKTYQIILDGMKKCDEALSGDKPSNSTSGNGSDTDLSYAYGDAVSVANNYCLLTDQTIAAAKNGTDAELKKVVAAKVMFEHNMEDSYKGNAERRDSILNLIKPCVEKEVQFRHNNQ